MKCPNCGEMIKEKKKMNFCGFCGSNLKTGEKTLTEPDFNDDFAPAAEAVEKIANFTPDSTVNPPLPQITNNASPFEQMVKESAAAQGFGGFQATVVPPSFDSVPSQAAVPSFDAPKPEEETKSSVSGIGGFDPSSLSAFDPYKAQEAAAKANAGFDFSFKPSAPAAEKPAAEEKPVTEVKPVAPAAASPIGSFDPSSLSAFNPYKAQEAAAKANDTVPAESEEKTVSFKDALVSLVEETSEPVNPVIPEEKNEEPEETKAPEKTARRSGYQGINISKNVKIRNASDDPNANPITYMEYTKSTDTSDEDTDDKYSSFSFGTPASEEIKSNIEEAEKKQEETRKEEARKAIDESVDSILSFSSHKTADETDKASESSSEAVPSINLSKENDVPAEPVSVKEPEPVPEPEPAKEKVINYIGQEKKAAEQMITFKGLVPEVEYVDDEKDFNFVIGQSIPADTEVLPGTVIKLTVSAGTWSAWEENPMPVSEKNYLIETKTEYRKRSRTRSLDKRDTTDTSGLEDYTLTGQDSKYSDWEVDQYYSSEAVPPGPTCEIVRVSNGFKYAGWFNPANMNGMSFSSPDVANFFNTNLSNVKWTYDEIISEENIKPDVKNWKLVTDNMNATPAGDPMISNIFFSAHVVEGKSYAMKFGSAETEWYIYKKRTLLETVYHFEKEIVSDWSEWSEWAETELTGSEDCQVEKRVLTRSRRKIPNA